MSTETKEHRDRGRCAIRSAFWLEAQFDPKMTSCEVTTRLRQAHASASVARSDGPGDPTVGALAGALSKLLGKGGSGGRLWGAPTCTFNDKTVKAMVDRLAACPCDKAPGRSRWCSCSFAHCLWVVASPGLQWIATALSRDEPLAWSPKLQA